MQVNLFRTIIPLIIMLISSCLIFWRVRKNRRNFGVLNANQKKDYQMSMVLITSDFTFLIFKLPTLINIFFNFNVSNKVIFNFLNSIFALIGTLHSASNFFLIFNFKQILSCFIHKINEKNYKIF